MADAVNLQSLVGTAGDPAALRCCCGRDDCVFLKHNCSVLDSVEKDVHTAARLGQALLARHEAYMASAERDRLDMQARIEQLETDKKELEAENARTIEENRALLDQLEELNNSAADTETRMRSLEATLKTSQQTVRRLEGAASRTTDLEKHITILETEQGRLQNSLITTESQARSAMQRWRKAERGIADLQEQLERIEKETQEERERHAEVLGRMERQRAMERDLNTAAGRLKGAAAARSLNDGKNSNNVVSHFVRDLLQDNANLQVGLAELREMLMNSNDEIQHLREQLMYHQPAGEGESSAASTLRAELDQPEEDHQLQRPQPTTTVSQELHIHHHYHVTSKAEPKKPKKRRHVLNAGIFTPPAALSPSTPPSSGHWHLAHGSPAPALISHSVRDSISTVPSNRWSVFSEQPSEFAPSSVPSSPMSNHRNSLFDKGAYDTSSPTSPTTSEDVMSPEWARHKQENSVICSRNFQAPVPLSLGDSSVSDAPSGRPVVGGSDPLSGSSLCEVASPGTPGDASESNSTTMPSGDSTLESTPTDDQHEANAILDTPLTPTFHDTFQEGNPRPVIRRVISHESVISLAGGLDIHTLKARPSQLTLRPLGAASADTGLSTVTARPTMSRGNAEGKRGSVILRENLNVLALPVPHTPGGSLRSVTGPAVPCSPLGTPERQRHASSGLGKLVGWRPWASHGPDSSSTSSPSTPPASMGSARSLSPRTPGASRPGVLTANGTAESPIDTSKARARSGWRYQRPAAREAAAFVPRTPGINQPGVVPGFQEYWAAHQRRLPPSRVTAVEVDTEALREGLEDG